MRVHRSRRWGISAGMIAVALGAWPLELVGQVELSFQAGVYLPVADVGVTESEPGFGGGGTSSRFVWSHGSAASLGGRILVWVSDRLAVEGALAYSPSELTLTETSSSGLTVEETSLTDVWTLSGRAVWRLGDPRRPVSYRLLAGFGLVRRAGEAYERTESSEFTGTTDPLLVVGGGLRTAVGSRLALQLQIEDHAYFTHIKILGPERQLQDGTTERPTTDLGRQLQNDVIVSLSLAVGL